MLIIPVIEKGVDVKVIAEWQGHKGWRQVDSRYIFTRSARALAAYGAADE
jgi:hypothetical protein